MAATSTARSAVLDVLALAGIQMATASDLSSGKGMPTADARAGLDTFIIAGSSEGFDALGVPLKATLAKVVDWHEPKFSCATKSLVKAVGSAMTSVDGQGDSLYPNAVEMVSFLAVCAPLLDPERLTELASKAAAVPSAYGPMRYLLGPSGQLSTLMSGYSPDRRLRMLSSLWEAAHDGRWWNHTTGDGFVRNDGRRRNGRRTKRADLTQEQIDVLRGQVDSLVSGQGVPQASLMRDAIATRTLSWSPDAESMMRRMPKPDPVTLRDLVEELERSDDEDHRVLAAAIPWIPVKHRPESPIGTMISVLLTSLGGPLEFRFAEHMPADPQEWEELYPEASREAFDFPNAIRKLNGTAVPGLAGSALHLCWNPDLLKRNGDYMGNCTFSYLGRCQDGAQAIIRIEHAGEDYNAALLIGGAGPVAVGEINSRFNRGNVPDAVRTAIVDMARGIVLRRDA